MPFRRRDSSLIQLSGHSSVARRQEIDEVIRTTRLDTVEQFFGKVAVRVNEPDAVAGGDVLHDEIAQQGRFSRTGLADEIEVMALVGSRNSEGDFVPPSRAGCRCW
jgi:hypothetical protein